MKNGIYRVLFNVGPNAGTGIVTIQNGRVSGGDDGFYYVGQVDGDQDLSAELDIAQHNAGAQNVFAGLRNFHVSASGKQITPDVARLQGTTPAAPGHTVHAELTLLSAF